MRTIDTETNAIAYLLPAGRVFANKFIPSTVVRRVLRGLAVTTLDVSDFIFRIGEEFFPDVTTELIEEWESLVGIPNAFFKGDGDIATRRTHVVAMLRANGAQTEQDFIDLAAGLGHTIEVDHNVPSVLELLPLDVPFIPAAFELNGSFIWTCRVLGEPVPAYLELFFNSLKSIETLILYETAP